MLKRLASDTFMSVCILALVVSTFAAGVYLGERLAAPKCVVVQQVKPQGQPTSF